MKSVGQPGTDVLPVTAHQFKSSRMDAVYSAPRRRSWQTSLRPPAAEVGQDGATNLSSSRDPRNPELHQTERPPSCGSLISCKLQAVSRPVTYEKVIFCPSSVRRCSKGYSSWRAKSLESLEWSGVCSFQRLPIAILGFRNFCRRRNDEGVAFGPTCSTHCWCR